jgi:hypothetical protein
VGRTRLAYVPPHLIVMMIVFGRVIIFDGYSKCTAFKAAGDLEGFLRKSGPDRH